MIKMIYYHKDLRKKLNEYLDFYCFMHCIIRLSNLTTNIDIPNLLINNPYDDKSEVSDLFQNRIDFLYKKDGLMIMDSIHNMNDIVEDYGRESAVLHVLASERENPIDIINYLYKDLTKKITFKDISKIPDNEIQNTFPNLKELELLNCGIDINENQFLNLITLDINNCTVENEIKLSEMPFLKKVNLVNLKEMKEINIDLQNLQNLIIENCSNDGGVKIVVKQSLGIEMKIALVNINEISELNLLDIFIDKLRIINTTLISCPSLEEFIIPINEIYLDDVKLKFKFDFTELINEEESLIKLTLRNCSFNKKIDLYNLIQKLLKEKIADKEIHFKLNIFYCYDYEGEKDERIDNEKIKKFIESLGNVDYYNEHFKYEIET